jgi:hypothetical protein
MWHQQTLHLLVEGHPQQQIRMCGGMPMPLCFFGLYLRCCEEHAVVVPVVHAVTSVAMQLHHIILQAAAAAAAAQKAPSNALNTPAVSLRWQQQHARRSHTCAAATNRERMCDNASSSSRSCDHSLTYTAL